MHVYARIGISDTEFNPTAIPSFILLKYIFFLAFLVACRLFIYIIFCLCIIRIKYCTLAQAAEQQNGKKRDKTKKL